MFRFTRRTAMIRTRWHSPSRAKQVDAVYKINAVAGNPGPNLKEVVPASAEIW